MARCTTLTTAGRASVRCSARIGTEARAPRACIRSIEIAPNRGQHSKSCERDDCKSWRHARLAIIASRSPASHRLQQPCPARALNTSAGRLNVSSTGSSGRAGPATTPAARPRPGTRQPGTISTDRAAPVPRWTSVHGTSSIDRCGLGPCTTIRRRGGGTRCAHRTTTQETPCRRKLRRIRTSGVPRRRS